MSRVLPGVMLCLWPVASAAQVPATDEEKCLAGIPAAALTRVPVYLEATPATSSRPLLPVADTIASVAARLIRASFAAGDTLPHGDELLNWQQLDGGLVVALHRNGRFSWSPTPADRNTVVRAAPDTTTNPARILLAQALSVVRDAGVHAGWPPDSIGDSLLFRLAYVRASVTQRGTVEPPKARAAFPVFALPVPRERQVSVRRKPDVHYPATSRSERAEGTVILRFVVDTAGHVQQHTVEELWGTDRPRLTGNLGQLYGEFLQAAIRGLQAARFVPAMIGGCVVSQIAQMPFEFHLSR